MKIINCLLTLFLSMVVNLNMGNCNRLWNDKDNEIIKAEIKAKVNSPETLSPSEKEWLYENYHIEQINGIKEEAKKHTGIPDSLEDYLNMNMDLGNFYMSKGRESLAEEPFSEAAFWTLKLAQKGMVNELNHLKKLNQGFYNKIKNQNPVIKEKDETVLSLVELYKSRYHSNEQLFKDKQGNFIDIGDNLVKLLLKGFSQNEE